MAITYHDNENNLSGAGQLKHVETVNTLGDASNMFKYSSSSIQLYTVLYSSNIL